MTKLMLSAGMLLLLGLASASAQEGPPPTDGHMPDMHPTMEGHHRMGRPMMGQKAAVFRFRKEGAEIVIKCAEDEPTRACVDGAMMLIDKVAADIAK